MMGICPSSIAARYKGFELYLDLQAREALVLVSLQHALNKLS